jgi:cellulose synthase (UDP-forming)
MTRVLNRRQLAWFMAGIAAWFVALGYFWSWWVEPGHLGSPGGYLLVSFLIAWIVFEPLYFLWMFSGARRAKGQVNLPAGSRVAMVVTKAPSEPFSVVKETLLAMLGQDYRHDTWLADENPSAETLDWCRRNGVWVSTRIGREDYHRATWPRRTRCKEGNLAFFYDNFGYHFYDFVAQLDADHAPEPSYLREILRPFADPRIGYVSAPSICDKNAAQSWSARGRLYAEASMHGDLQAGYSGGWAPMCIGSHYAVRTQALKEIGGLGPELAEDHSTTLMMNASGWRGAHALDAIAHGDGPQTFADMIVQEFQWSRSLMTLLLQYTPRHLPGLTPRLKFQFLFCQLWYPLFAGVMGLMFLMPIIALATGDVYANVTYLGFLLHFLPVSLCILVISLAIRRLGINRPYNAKFWSWERPLFTFARWPWVLAGSAAALRDWITGTNPEFRVTPKGSDPAGPLPTRVLLPYAILSAASALATLLVGDAGRASGFYIFALINSAIYAILLLVIVISHIRENRIEMSRSSMRAFVHAALMVLMLVPTAAATAMRAPYGVEALTWGNGFVSLTRDTYAVSGAGQDGARHVKFEFRWLGGLRTQIGQGYETLTGEPASNS